MSPRAACRLDALGFSRVYDYVEGISDWKAAGVATEGVATAPPRVADAIRNDVPTCRPDEAMSTVRRRAAEAGWDSCVVLDCDDLAIGRIRGSGLGADPDERAAAVMEPGPSTVRPDAPLHPLVERMRDRNAPNVLVTTPQGKFLGILLQDEAARLLAGEAPERIWRDCECCPGRWADSHDSNDGAEESPAASENG